MADAKKCDICGEFYEPFSKLRKSYATVEGYNQSLHIRASFTKGANSGSEIDLCQTCLVETFQDITDGLKVSTK